MTSRLRHVSSLFDTPRVFNQNQDELATAVELRFRGEIARASSAESLCCRDPCSHSIGSRDRALRDAAFSALPGELQFRFAIPLNHERH